MRPLKALCVIISLFFYVTVQAEELIKVEDGEVLKGNFTILDNGEVHEGPVEVTENNNKEWHINFLKKQLNTFSKIDDDKILVLSSGWLNTKCGPDFVLKVNQKFNKFDDHGTVEYTLKHIGDSAAKIIYESKFYSIDGSNKLTIDKGEFDLDYINN